MTVMIMLNASTMKGVSIVYVQEDSQEMEPLVMVKF